MKIHHDVLSLSLVNEIEQEILKNFDDACWRVSGLSWIEMLREGITGEVFQTPVSSSLKDKIDKQLKRYYPGDNTSINVCLYSKGAGLAIHNDAGWKWAATIYLNRTWNKNFGGVFLYSDNIENDVWSAVFPKFNSMIVNDNSEPHMVTPVSMKADSYRAILQIWGE